MSARPRLISCDVWTGPDSMNHCARSYFRMPGEGDALIRVMLHELGAGNLVNLLAVEHSAEPDRRLDDVFDSRVVAMVRQ